MIEITVRGTTSAEKIVLGQAVARMCKSADHGVRLFDDGGQLLGIEQIPTGLQSLDKREIVIVVIGDAITQGAQA